ncbi:MAG: pseudaminic acid cytidylyltransferase [Bacteroidaceae bacterium]|jgi:pseudaminic acid cytidylyltransferase|nr:pseudaminic acid cytidylyltransferase [Bacteroidaceae bacterium]
MINLAIIPARGGSKRIPRKNIRDFLGKPILAYSIETALQSDLFDEVMVSTDDEEIATIAIQYGAIVPFIRNKQTANDIATLSDVVEEVKSEYYKRGITFDNICCILPTAPLVSINILKQGIKLLIEKKADSVRPIVQFSYPIQRSFRLDKNGRVSLFYPEYSQARSQDLELAYHDAGMFYWMKSEKGLKGENRYGLEISEMDCQDIDNEVDWEIAELKYKLKRSL